MHLYTFKNEKSQDIRMPALLASKEISVVFSGMPSGMTHTKGKLAEGILLEGRNRMSW